jgi:uncharacterized membrane protein
VEPLFLSTFVLITQNRMATEADKRAELSRDVAPEKVMEKMEANERAIGDRPARR